MNTATARRTLELAGLSVGDEHIRWALDNGVITEDDIPVIDADIDGARTLSAWVRDVIRPARAAVDGWTPPPCPSWCSGTVHAHDWSPMLPGDVIYHEGGRVEVGTASALLTEAVLHPADGDPEPVKLLVYVADTSLVLDIDQAGDAAEAILLRVAQLRALNG